MPTTRLDRYVSNSTDYSRSQVRELVKHGRVSVDGVTVQRFDLKVDTERSTVCVDGSPVSEFGLRYYMMNKPCGVVCSTEDGDSKTVIDLLPAELQNRGLFPAGRLDKDTEGFVLLTNDGEFAHRILSSRHHVPKYYLVRLARPFEDSYVEAFSKGVHLSNGEVCLPSRVAPCYQSERYAVVELFEGKYHQVKRMFASVGNHVEYLYRFQIGNLPLDPNIPKGGYLEVLHKDLNEILKNPDINLFNQEVQTSFSSFITNI